jgi:hypothetical protein
MDSILSWIQGLHDNLTVYMTADVASSMAKGCAESEKLKSHLIWVNRVINNCMNDIMRWTK